MRNLLRIVYCFGLLGIAILAADAWPEYTLILGWCLGALAMGGVWIDHNLEDYTNG